VRLVASVAHLAQAMKYILALAGVIALALATVTLAALCRAAAHLDHRFGYDESATDNSKPPKPL
jgi:CHASE1-domain containing sensor protein